MSRGRPPLHLSSRTLVVSALAVVALYSAGFAHTRSAALRLTQESGRRRPVDMREVQQVLDVARFATDTGSGPVLAPHLEPTPSSTPAAAAPDNTRRDPVVSPVAQAPAAASLLAAASVTPGATTPDVRAASPAADQTSGVQTAPGGEGASATAAAPVAADVPAPSVPPSAEPPTYRDGTFTGWGRCRHGEIQARVVIEHGRITDAVITQCLTRYSCDWIAKLPPQVVSRQSEEVDFVSGATESADAFYYAVSEALKQAR